MQAELGLLQQAVEIHGLVLAFHRSWGRLVRAAIWGWQGQKAAGSGRGISVLVGREMRHSRALLTALLLHSQAGHSGDGDTEKSWGRGAAARPSWAGHKPLAFTARG